MPVRRIRTGYVVRNCDLCAAGMNLVKYTITGIGTMCSMKRHDSQVLKVSSAAGQERRR
jgi:hypothetical protein